jgi:cell division protein FtsL
LGILFESDRHEEQKPHLRVVERAPRTAAQRIRRNRAIVGGCAVLALGVAFALVYLHVLLAQRQFKLNNLNNQVQQEQASYQKLRLQVAELSSPQNIISIAEGRLGMVQPAQVTYVAPNTTIAASPPRPAAAASSRARASASGSSAAPASGPAPAGDADWPAIKSQLAGSP